MKSKVIHFEGRALEVREMTIGVAIPIISGMKLGGEEAVDAQLEMLDKCTFENGEPVKATDLPFSVFSELSDAAAQVNGFASDEESGEA